MIRFLGIAVFAVIALGLAIHSGWEFPWFLNWLGKLPGDLLIKKGLLTAYVPVTSSLLVSGVLSLFCGAFSKEQK